MKITTTVENGKLVPQQPLRFSRTKVEIDVPDDAVMERSPKPSVESAGISTGNPDIDGWFARIWSHLPDGYQYQPHGLSDKELFGEALERSGKYR
jgi:hypothetical protein